MRFFPVALFFIHVFPHVLAAPTSSLVEPSTLTSHSPLPTTATSKIPSLTSTSSTILHTAHTTTRSFHPFTRSLAPPPTRFTSAADANSTHQHRTHSQNQKGQRNLAIALETIGGVLLVGLLIAISRCIHKYRRAPKRNRIAEVVQRHNLDAEMDELLRNPLALRRPSLREPAPPYFPRPPSYSDSVCKSPPATATHFRQSSELLNHSPPPSPPPTATRLLRSPSPPAIMDVRRSSSLPRPQR